MKNILLALFCVTGLALLGQDAQLAFRAQTIVHRTPTDQLLAADTNLLAQVGTNGIYGPDGTITNTTVRPRALRFYHRQIDAANSDADLIAITNRIAAAKK